MVKSHSSVGIVLYHAEQDALLIVRQFRPAVSSPDLLRWLRTHVWLQSVPEWSPQLNPQHALLLCFS